MAESHEEWERPHDQFVGPDWRIHHVFEAPRETRYGVDAQFKALVFTDEAGRWIGRAVVPSSYRLEALQLRDLLRLLRTATRCSAASGPGG